VVVEWSVAEDDDFAEFGSSDVAGEMRTEGSQ